MGNETQKKLFDALLTEAGINPEQFYRLFHALEEAPYIKRDSIRVTHKQPNASFTLMVKYEGNEQIGRARVDDQKRVKPGALETAARIYSDISQRSGIQFTRVLPALDDEECIGYAIVGMAGRSDSLLPLVIEK